MTEEPKSAIPTRSVPAGVVAALVPLLAIAGAGVLLAPLLDGAPLSTRLHAAPLGFAVLGAAALTSLGLAALLFVLAWRGSPIPLAVTLAVASGPWLLGALFTTIEMVRARGAVAYASVDMGSALMSDGVAESLFGVVAGAWLSGALLCASGLGLAIGAVARRADARLTGRDRLWPAALTVLAALVVTALPVVFRDAVADWLFLYPALFAAALALTLAAASVGRDQASGRLAAGAAFAALLGVTATLLAVRAQSITIGFMGAAHAAPAERGRFLAQGLAGSVVGMDLALFVGLAVGLVVAVVAALAIARGPRRGPLVIGGVAALAVAVVMLAGDRYVEASIRTDIASVTGEPWDGLDDFEPSHGSTLEPTTAPHALVTRTEVVPYAGAPVALTDRAALDALFARLRDDEEEPRWTEDAAAADLDPSSLEPFEEDEEAEAPRGDDVAVERELVLALDARVDRARVMAVLEAVGRAGVGAVSLVGRSGPEIDGGALGARDPLWGRLARGPLRRELLLLEPALRPGAADRDPSLLHGTIDGAEELTLEARRGPPQRVHYARVDWRDEGRLDDALVYLRVGEDVSPVRLLEAARVVRMLGGRPLLVFGDFPGHPERDLATDLATDGDPLPTVEADAVERGRVEVAALEDEAGSGLFVERGRVEVAALEDEAGSGLFDPSIVTRSIRTRTAAIRHCYERLLATEPTLAGRVLVRFTVEPSGTLSGVVASGNTTERPALAECVVEPIARLRFNPGPEGGSVTYTYPFVFTPQP